MQEIKRRSKGKPILIILGIVVIGYALVVGYSMLQTPKIIFYGIENTELKYETKLPLGLSECTRKTSEQGLVNGDDFMVNCSYSWVPIITKEVKVEVSGLYKNITIDSATAVLTELVSKQSKENLEYVLFANEDTMGSTLHFLYNVDDKYQVKSFRELYLDEETEDVVQPNGSNVYPYSSELSIIVSDFSTSEYSELVNNGYLRLYDSSKS